MKMKNVHLGVFFFFMVVCPGLLRAVTVNFTLQEEEREGYAVGDVLEARRGSLNVTNISSLRFRMLASNTLFSINDLTGVIYTSVQIDREFQCKGRADCLLEFAVNVFEGESFLEQVEVKITITDINDNSPQFPREVITLHVPENSAVGSTFRIDSATDADSGGNNSVQTYALVPDSESEGVFALQTQENNLDGGHFVRLQVIAELDRERKDRFQVQVVARDGGEPSKSGTLTVAIEVGDVNDNSPVFIQNSYNVIVNESTPNGTKILQVQAIDADAGENGRLVYRLKDLPSLSASAETVFSVNENTGDVVVKSDLTYLAGQAFHFLVIAYDNGDDPNLNQTEVTVNIRDTTNDKPKVTVILPPGNPGFANISEAAQENTYIGHVRVEDTDTGLNGEISCSLSDSHFRIKTVVPGESFVVEVRGDLDYEVQPVYNLTVTCRDQGTPPLSGAVSFLVRLSDENDNKPVFDQGSYTARLPENSDGNSILVQVSAHDSDSGSNGMVHYEMHGDGLDRFTVDRKSGVVSVVSALDREVADVIRFHVLAVDAGFPSQTGTTEIVLTVEDVNDNAPEFNNTVNALQIPENLPPDSHVGNLAAFDSDAGRNAEFYFKMSETDSGQVPFVVYANGQVKSNRMLNREDRSRYDFTVIVTDRGTPNLTSSAHVTVFVVDRNDNAPNITFPRPENNTLTVWYPEFQNPYVTTIKAYDMDQGINQELDFAIRSGNELGIFAIEESSGDLYFTPEVVDIKSDLVVTLTLSVTDRGDPRLESSADLKVKLQYTNATQASEARNEDSTYIVIAVVVVVVTVLVSGGIIATILLLRTLDKKRQKKENNNRNGDSDFGFSESPPTSSTIVDSLSSTSDYQDEAVVKKKEVSFVLDTGDSSDLYRQQYPGTTARTDTLAPQKSLLRSPASMERPASLDTRALQETANSQLQTIKLQQMILQTRAKQWIQQQQQQQQQQFGSSPPPHHHEDHHSETSGETIGSDSGRGCSEEDDVHSSPSADDPKTFELMNPGMQVHFSPPQPMHQLDSADHGQFQSDSSKPSYERQPWTRKAHLANRDYRPSYFSNSRPSHITNFQNQSSLPLGFHDNGRPQGGVAGPYSNVYYPGVSPMDYTGDSALHSFFDKTPVGFSRDDDEYSTTTSGSYTLYSEDIL